MKHNSLTQTALDQLKLIVLAGCTIAASTLDAAYAQSRNTISESLLYQPHTLHNGWRKDVNVLTHFSGMFCPDYLGALSRSALVPDMSELGTGCIYETENGEIKAIFRRHKKGTATQIINNYTDGFKQSKFQQLTTGISPDKVAFRTEITTGAGRVESFAAYTALTADYTVWTSIYDQLPLDQLEQVHGLLKNLATQIEQRQLQN